MDHSFRLSPVVATTAGLILGLRGQQPAPSFGFRASPAANDAQREREREVVRYDGESHLMTFGSTGSGKTSGPVISNALEHPGSLISIECKGEVYAATADHRRRMGQQVVLLSLRGEDSGGEDQGAFNPVDGFLTAGGGSGLTARSIAATIVPRGGEDIFWRNWAETMLTGGISYTLDHAPEGQRNLSHVFDIFNNDDVVYNLAVLMDKHGRDLDRSAYSAFAGFLQLPEKETRPSVLGSTQQHLMLWESDLIRKVTGRTSFDLQGLVRGDPISLYIVVPPLRMAAYVPVLRLWLAALLSALMSRTEQPRHRTLMLCDELGALGRVEAFVTASTLLRSAGLQLWSFWQNPAQLDLYGADARTLVDNAGVLQMLGAKNHRAAGEFAALVGGVTADRVMAMGPNEQLVIVDGGAPQILDRFRYFEHPWFAQAARSLGRPSLTSP